MENPDGESGFTQIGSDIHQGTETLDLEIPLLSRTSAEYILQSCNRLGCVDSSTLTIDDGLNDIIGYIKPSDVHQGTNFGNAVSLSGDGETLAVSARGEDGNATGTQASAEEQADNSTSNRGVVYLY